MKKRKILTGLLLVSVAALSFVACGKKKNKQTTNKITTKSNITTKNNTTRKDEVTNVSKLYMDTNDYIFIRTEVEKDNLSDLKIMFEDENCISIRPNMTNGNFDSVSVTSLLLDNEEPFKVIKKDNSTPIKIGYTNDWYFDGYESFINHFSLKLTNDLITIYHLDKTYTISNKGVVSNNFSAITNEKTAIDEDLTVTYKDNKLTIINEENDYVYTEATIRKDLFIAKTGNNNESCIKYNDNGTITLYNGHYDSGVLDLNNNKTITLSSDGYLKKVVEGPSTSEYTYSPNKDSLTILVSEENDSSLLSTNTKLSKMEFSFNESGAPIQQKEYEFDNDANDYVLKCTTTYAYDNKGNIAELTTDSYKWVDTYNANGYLVKTLWYDKVGSDYVLDTTIEITFDSKNRGIKYLRKEGSLADVITRDFTIEYENDEIKNISIISYDEYGKLEGYSFKKEITFNENMYETNVKEYSPKVDGSGFYLDEERVYEYSTSEGYEVTTYYKTDYEEDGTFDKYKTISKLKENEFITTLYDFDTAINDYLVKSIETKITNNDKTRLTTIIYYEINSSNESVIDYKEEYLEDEKGNRIWSKDYDYDGENYLLTTNSTYFENTSELKHSEQTRYDDSWIAIEKFIYEYELVYGYSYIKTETDTNYYFGSGTYSIEYNEYYNLNDTHNHIRKIHDYKEYEMDSDDDVENDVLIESEYKEYELGGYKSDSHIVKQINYGIDDFYASGVPSKATKYFDDFERIDYVDVEIYYTSTTKYNKIEYKYDDNYFDEVVKWYDIDGEEKTLFLDVLTYIFTVNQTVYTDKYWITYDDQGRITFQNAKLFFKEYDDDDQLMALYGYDYSYDENGLIAEKGHFVKSINGDNEIYTDKKEIAIKNSNGFTTEVRVIEYEEAYDGASNKYVARVKNIYKYVNYSGENEMCDKCVLKDTYDLSNYNQLWDDEDAWDVDNIDDKLYTLELENIIIDHS